MCGITGIAGYLNNPIENIQSMNQRIVNRGPDATGHWIDENRKVILGHQRLSIIDLSELGAQPMVSHSDRYVIVYNGEIYNANELREELEEQFGIISWNGHSDTEILLEAVEKFGLIKTLNKCRGMWGMAIYDRETGNIQLARDRMGEKPLYYGMVQGQFVFSSDINAIRSIEGFNNEVNEDTLGIYFQNGYIPAPYSIYKNVYKLEPGSILSIAYPYSDWKIEKYYNICETAVHGQNNLFEGSEEEAADRLESILKDVLKGQMLSDVPLGAFLSGGIDSTLVVSLMQSISNRPIKTFTIGFEEEKYNEAKFALETARHLGTDHTEMYVGYSDVMDLLPNISKAFGEPFADSSQLPTMLVSRMTKKHVTVALSGDAGDEFYCGYNTYKDARAGISVMKGKLGVLKNPLRKKMGDLLLDSCLAENNLVRTVGRCLSIETVEDFYRMVRDDDIRSHKLVNNNKIPPTAVTKYKDGMLKTEESNLMLMDMLQYLPDDILTKVDRSGMYYSLETRIPLLDRDVMEFAWSLPLDYKMDDGITKKPLRNILYKYVPKEMMDRPKKGFSVPVSRWLREGDMKAWAESLIVDNRGIASEFIDVKLFAKMWSDYQKGGNWNSLIWFVLMFEQWCGYAL